MLTDQRNILYAATTSSYIYHNMLPFIEMMDERGYQVDVLSSKDHTSMYLDKHPSIRQVYEMNMRPSPMHPCHLHTYHNLKKHFKNHSYSIIHTQTPAASMLIGLASRKNKKTKIVHVAEDFSLYRGAPLKNWLVTFPATLIASLYTDALVTTNRHDYRFAERWLKHCRIHYIPGMGYDLKSDTEKSIDKHFRRVIVCVNDFTKRKNQDIMVRAIPHILKRLDDIEVWFLGQGDLIKKCIDLSKEMNINSNIEWMGNRSDIERLLYKADLAVFTSLSEGFPHTLLKAMACGKPIVAFNINKIRELVIDGYNGYLVPPGDEKALAEACIKVMQHPYMALMGDISRFLARKYDVEHVKQLMLSIYKIR